MFKIGEFSKMVQVPVPTLRYYDQMGLLKPVEVVETAWKIRLKELNIAAKEGILELSS